MSTVEEAAPARRGPGILARIGCILLAIVVLVVLAGLVIVGLFLDRFTASPQDIAGDFVSAAVAERYGEAHGLLCGRLREELPQPRMERLIADHRASLGSIQRTEHTVTIPRLEGLSVYWRLDGTRDDAEIELLLVRDWDQWRICRLEWPDR
jgi:hypothetical protein